jgi:[ribosomal protein S18]-alanine N-acetyltransferase
VSGPWLRPVTADDAATLADLHAQSFDAPWDAAAMVEVLAGFGAAGLIAGWGAAAEGLLLLRAVAGEAEVLTLAVAPRARRRGLARALVQAGADLADAAGASSLWLEVAVDNAAALGLYRSLGFSEAGRRPGYYARPGGAVDALVMRRPLNSGPASDYVRAS